MKQTSGTWPSDDADPAAVIAQLRLKPLPLEGGFFASTGRTDPLSSILFLLTDAHDGFSAFHRLDVTEGWQWLAGAPAEIVVLEPADSPRAHRLTRTAPLIVPAGRWQAATTLGRWTLAACWCAPAYTDDGCTFGQRDGLTADFPAAGDDIRRLTRTLPG